MNKEKSKTGSLSVLGVLVLAIIILTACQASKVNTDANKNPNGRNDTWGFIGIGGGGAMFNPAISPHNPDFGFVSCDMGGSFVTYDGGESWRMFNLHGQVHYYVFDPLDSNTVYANSIGLFKSMDKGNTWSLLYPAPSEIIGFVPKGDHAEEVLFTKDSSNRKVLALAVDPEDSKKLYAAISINKVEGFYVSDDAGLHWKMEFGLTNSAQKIYIDPSSPKQNRAIYVAGNTGIALKTDGVWKNNNKPKDVAKLTTCSGGYDPKLKKVIIYAITGNSYFNADGDISGIFYTENGGITWENRQDGLLDYRMKDAGIPEWRTIAASAMHPEVVYVSYNGLQVNKDTTCIGVAKSNDYGKTWKLVWKDLLTKNVQFPSANFSADWLNERFGPTWGENPFSIGVSPTDPEICLATDFGRTIKTSNGGKTWQQVYSKNVNGSAWTSRGLEVTTGYSVVFDPFDEKHVFITNTDIGLIESNNATESWTSATKNNGIPNKWINSCYWLTFDPEVKGKAWAAMSGVHDLPRPKMFRKKGTAGFTGGILVTENSGKSWQPISTDIGEAAMTHILIDPASSKQKRTLYACAFGKGVFKSMDDGKTWVQKNNGIAGDEPFAWRIVRREKDGVLFLIISRRSEDGSIGTDKDGALYRSEDGAENWIKVELPSGTNAPTSLAIDPQNPHQLILSAWGRKTAGQFTPDTCGGIFLSVNEGKTWKHVMEKDQHIHDITYDTRNNWYYACGFNASAYYSEDQGKTWLRIKGYNFKWGKRVELDPRDPEKIYIVTFGGGVWYGPAKGDENAVEDIITRF